VNRLERKVDILNISIDNLSTAELLEELEHGIVFTPNVDHLIKLQKDFDFYKAYCTANYILCDSQILIYASRILNKPIREKISGSDFFPAFCEHHKNNKETKIFLLGGLSGTALKAKEVINTKLNSSIIVEAHSPSFGFDQKEDECQKIIEMVNSSGATVLAVGVGAPKQEKFISKYRHQMPNIKIFLGIGATIAFEAGTLPRSPRWMSNIGLEWLYRLCSEPSRLWKRYLIEDSVFFWLLTRQMFNVYVSPFQSESYQDASDKTSSGVAE